MKYYIIIVLALMSTTSWANNKIIVEQVESNGQEFEISYVKSDSSKKIYAMVTKLPLQLNMGVSREFLNASPFQEESSICELYSKADLLNIVNQYNTRNSTELVPHVSDHFEALDMHRVSTFNLDPMEIAQDSFKRKYFSYDVNFILPKATEIDLRIKYSQEARYQAFEKYRMSEQTFTSLNEYLTKGIVFSESFPFGINKLKIQHLQLRCDLLEGKSSIELAYKANTPRKILSTVDISSDKEKLKLVVKNLYENLEDLKKAQGDRQTLSFLAGLKIGKAIEKSKYSANKFLHKKYGETFYFELFKPLFDFELGQLHLNHLKQALALKSLVYKFDQNYNLVPRFKHEDALESVELSGKINMNIKYVEAPKWEI